ncbi:MAG: hypothetical protein N2248_00465 [candidate division WOR-3 bacterium]|nr:hypothetical protein [candidate division WOR-3 bacterium]
MNIKISIDRTEITRVSYLRVERTVGYEADYFSLSLPNIGGKFTALFADTEGKKVQISINQPVVFTGFCDSADFSFIPKPEISIRGRDLTGILIDETITPELSSQLKSLTASEIVQKIAQKFGFSCDVDRTTKIWSEENLFPDNTSVWAALVQLAQKEAFDLYCTPKPEIVFKKRSYPNTISRSYSIPPPEGEFLAPSSLLIPQSLAISQDKTLALALKVKVIGYDPKRKQRIVYTAESRLRNRPHYKLIEIIDHSLNTKDLVKTQAQNLLTQISKNLLTGTLTVPLDPELNPGLAISLQFLGNQDQTFAGNYIITQVTHEINFDGSATSEISFASRPLAEARDMEIEEIKPPPMLPLP